MLKLEERFRALHRYAAELHDFLTSDVKRWYPDLQDKVEWSIRVFAVTIVVIAVADVEVVIVIVVVSGSGLTPRY